MLPLFVVNEQIFGNANGAKGICLSRCLLVSRMGSLPSWCGVVCLGFFFTLLTLSRVEARTWKYLSELSQEERRNIDPRTDTPRDATLSYLPAEPYPFTPPYTVEEMGIRAMEFPHIARWNFAMIEDFGSVMPTGYLSTGKTIVLSIYPEPEGLVGYFKSTPGDVYSRWLSQDTYPPENLGNQMLMLQHRTDQTATTKTDLLAYSPVLRRVRRFPQPRRQDRFPDNPMTFDDFLGRDAWGSSHGE